MPRHANPAHGEPRSLARARSSTHAQIAVALITRAKVTLADNLAPRLSCGGVPGSAKHKSADGHTR
jgi:hypothetical protein